MTASTSQSPLVPPRPSRTSDKDGQSPSTTGMPRVPPRPSKRLDRSVSPATGRFAPSPLNEALRSPQSSRFKKHDAPGSPHGPIDRPSSVSMPSVGEEGMEYSSYDQSTPEAQAVAGKETTKPRPTLPEQTRTIAPDLKLHAPKPSLPANTAKRQVMAVTRTDSEKAATFGIGRSSFEERSASRDGVKKKPSTNFSVSSDQGHHTDDDHGIPEIGQRVPMNPNLGDVQAPSPSPAPTPEGRHHFRKHSARNLPPGSYGLHGHGSTSVDRLDKQYYQKHPEIREKESHVSLHDRQNDYAMSSDDLNRLVMDTSNRASASRTSGEYRSGPTDEVAFQATDEFASRMATPARDNTGNLEKASDKVAFKAEVSGPDGEGVIHVDDARHPEYRSYGTEDLAQDDQNQEYTAHILASDEVGKDPRQYVQRAAIHPPPERHGSAFEEDEARNKPTSRPGSIHQSYSHQEQHTPAPLEDVEEYEPLFEDEAQREKEKSASAEEHRTRHQHHFPSKDIWEDAPNSVHYTAEVRSPDMFEDQSQRRKLHGLDESRRINPAHAFAQKQEQLAEREAQDPSGQFVPRTGSAPKWTTDLQQKETTHQQSSGHRFPSRDIWEDVPESQLQSTTLSLSHEEEPKPQVPSRPIKKTSDLTSRPSIPERPKPKKVPSDEAIKSRPPVSERPKPQIPAKSSSGDSKSGDFSKPKPPVPSRPFGGKIAALQAGFMSDLNKRLQLGPQGPKKEEEQLTSPQKDANEEKEKVPLSDARKSRARGPQRRAPATTATREEEPAARAAPALTFSMPQVSWEINPDVGDIGVSSSEAAAAAEEVQDRQPTPESSTSPAPLTKEPEGLTTEAEHEAQNEEPISADRLEDTEAVEQEEDQVMSSEPTEQVDQPIEPSESVREQTIVANTAGESILEAEIKHDDDKNDDEVIEVKDEVQP